MRDPLNLVERILISTSAFAAYNLFSSFTSFVSIPIGIKNSARGLKICAITFGIKKDKSIIKKKRKNMISHK